MILYFWDQFWTFGFRIFGADFNIFQTKIAKNQIQTLSIFTLLFCLKRVYKKSFGKISLVNFNLTNSKKFIYFRILLQSVFLYIWAVIKKLM